MLNRYSAQNIPLLSWPVNYTSEYAAIALFGFLKNGNQEAALAFIRAGAMLNYADDIGRTPLHWAALHGYRPVFQEVFKRYNPLAINHYLRSVTNVMKLTPVHYAFMNNNMYIANDMFLASIVDNKFNILSLLNKVDATGRNPIHWACSCENHEDVVYVFANWAATMSLDVSTILTSKNNDGFTPLHLALINNFHTTASLLLNPVVMPDRILKEALGITTSDQRMLSNLRLHLATFGVNDADKVFRTNDSTVLHTMEIIDYTMSHIDQGDEMPIAIINQKDLQVSQFFRALEKMRQAANLAELCF